jgi:acetyl-CoA carboxylase biotin carboxyl carrier protein
LESRERIVDLTNADVADILALLDSLPYDSLDVETPRFRLTLRRAPGGGWTEESQVLAEPTVLPSAPDGAPASGADSPGISEMPGGGPATGTPAAAGGTRTAAAGSANAAGGTGVAGADAAAGGAGAGDIRADAAGAAGAADSSGAGQADGLAVVAAPLPGTFYRAPRPGADPFVQVGDVVSPDTVVAIIETMKLMNSVHAGTAGRVARICRENGEFAPTGTTLLLIEPAA